MQRTKESPLGNFLSKIWIFKRELGGPPQKESITTVPLRNNIPRTNIITVIKLFSLMTMSQLIRAKMEQNKSIEKRPKRRSTATVVIASAYL